nr:hypothetical protein [Methanobacterium formicicum]
MEMEISKKRDGTIKRIPLSPLQYQKKFVPAREYPNFHRANREVKGIVP